ncbi:DUF7526 family protein [Halobacterium salinarum]|uniref:Uncharacterized protein n=3 Tax=Halobacterium salinarum TaxID=2242 RepID=A0A510N8K2_HALSA|nr:hypothetical protein [Halobacterium salinarum]MBB6089330.1 hypothetical protein [Halobacterium salinarum]MDL0129562.1 hypothetical protein [Halobacterium salinarum]MDL0142663.1 hypothetical protein [Halobacterium salinarum]UEB91666.1 hypothetical protein LJ422_08785 [Halobacterium salinarum NRC-34001]CAP14612.1 uncharacterized protein OE_4049R [Halobacterium salinarum R1]
MPETLTASVIHALPPEEHADADLEPALESLAADRYILVCRKGGTPTRIQRLLAFLRRDPIEAITVVADDAVPEDDEFTTQVTATELAGVYVVTDDGRAHFEGEYDASSGQSVRDEGEDPSDEQAERSTNGA